VQATQRPIPKMVVVVSVMIPIALLHFVTGSNYKGPYPEFVNGYLLDILVPFGFYFLLCPNDFSLLRSWIVKGVLVFGAASLVEVAQFFGVPIFGRTFDPVDFVMYAIGVTLAAILDTTVLPRIFEFWVPKVEGFHSEKRGIV
jgi:glycopeptide antibiotics resistance protein